MALSLVGIDPAAKRSYSWVGDAACDVGKSNLAQWLDSGDGLEPREGQSMTVLVCEALRPTTLQVVYGAAHGDVGNWAAVNRLAVAYSVVDILNGPAIRRVHGPGGQRLHDELLAFLETLRVDVKRDGVTMPLSLVQHLGGLIISDSEATTPEKKVVELPCMPEK